MGFPRQDSWSAFPFSSPGDLSNPGIKPMSPALAGGLFTIETPGKAIIKFYIVLNSYWSEVLG